MRLPALFPGRLLGRRQRFLADIELDSGEQVVAHCANTGSMLGCKAPGSRVWLSAATNPQRKLAWTWELVEAVPGIVVGIHTGRSNGLVEEAILAGVLPPLAGFGRVRREVRYGSENSRVDLLLENDAGPRCYVEVKNVTAAVEGGVALFPDAVSARGSKHLRELMGVVAAGERAAIVFCCQRADVHEVWPADAIDPLYGRTLREAVAAGVEAYALRAHVDVTAATITLDQGLTVVCP